MPSNSGLVTRFPKVAILHKPTGDSRPPTLVSDASVVVLKPRKSTKRAIRDWDWPLIVCALFIGGTLVAVFFR